MILSLDWEIQILLLLSAFVRTLLSSTGSLISTNKIRNTLISQNVSISHNTLENYLTTLTDSLLFYSVPRFDVKGRALLQRLEKYYPVDLGLRHLLLPDHKEILGISWKILCIWN